MIPWSRCNCWSRRESGRATTVTSWPTRASWYANVLPILPAPITAIGKGNLAAVARFFMTTPLVRLHPVRCWPSVDDVADPVQLMPGDCFLVPRGQPFCLGSDLSLASVDAATLFATTENGTIVSLNGGGDCFIVVRTSPWPAIMPLSSWER